MRTVVGLFQVHFLYHKAAFQMHIVHIMQPEICVQWVQQSNEICALEST